MIISTVIRVNRRKCGFSRYDTHRCASVVLSSPSDQYPLHPIVVGIRVTNVDVVFFVVVKGKIEMGDGKPPHHVRVVEVEG